MPCPKIAADRGEFFSLEGLAMPAAGDVILGKQLDRRISDRGCTNGIQGSVRLALLEIDWGRASNPARARDGVSAAEHAGRGCSDQLGSASRCVPAAVLLSPPAEEVIGREYDHKKKTADRDRQGCVQQ